MSWCCCCCLLGLGWESWKVSFVCGSMSLRRWCMGWWGWCSYFMWSWMSLRCRCRCMNCGWMGSCCVSHWLQLSHGSFSRGRWILTMLSCLLSWRFDSVFCICLCLTLSKMCNSFLSCLFWILSLFWSLFSSFKCCSLRNIISFLISSSCFITYNSLSSNGCGCFRVLTFFSSFICCLFNNCVSRLFFFFMMIMLFLFCNCGSLFFSSLQWILALFFSMSCSHHYWLLGQIFFTWIMRRVANTSFGFSYMLDRLLCNMFNSCFSSSFSFPCLCSCLC